MNKTMYPHQSKNILEQLYHANMFPNIDRNEAVFVTVGLDNQEHGYMRITIVRGHDIEGAYYCPAFNTPIDAKRQVIDTLYQSLETKVFSYVDAFSPQFMVQQDDETFSHIVQVQSEELTYCNPEKLEKIIAVISKFMRDNRDWLSITMFNQFSHLLAQAILVMSETDS